MTRAKLSLKKVAPPRPPKPVARAADVAPPKPAEVHEHGADRARSAFAQPALEPAGPALQGASAAPPPALTPQAWLAKVFGSQPDGRPFASEVDAVKANPQFVGQPAALQANILEELERKQQLINLVGGTNATSAFVRERLAERLAERLLDTTFWSSTPQAQADALAKFLEAPASYPALVTQAPAPFSVVRVANLGPAVPLEWHPFAGGAGPGLRYEVQVGATVVPVFVAPGAAPTGLLRNGIEEVAQALARLPEGLLACLPKVTLEARSNPLDDFWRQTYAGFDGAFMTADPSGVSIYPTRNPQDVNALASALVHESGHVISDRLWGETNDSRWTKWKDAEAKDVARASAYAANRPGEDFCETLRAYHAVRGKPAQAELEALFPARLAILRELQLV